MDAISSVLYANGTIYPIMEPECEIPKIPKGDVNGKITVKDAVRDEDSRSISFHNISYAVEERMWFKKCLPKVTLNNVRYVANLRN